jgi:ABC-type bacteriocin/lantibiotic exporter with double-glycine peptidase domain
VRFLVPEVIQTSAMDCGPASIKALMEGFGVPVSYGRLREACQTDVDGTSIDRLEEAAVALGLDASQMMAPADHLLLPDARLLPALVVVRLPNGATHFVVAWRRIGGLLQVMDPAIGRRWVSADGFLAEVYRHTQNVLAADWRAWAGSDVFRKTLQRRIRELGVPLGEADTRIQAAMEDPSWRSIAALDAATRMLESLSQRGALDRGAAMKRLLPKVASEAGTIPEPYWCVREGPTTADEVRFTGAVFVHVRGRKAPANADLSPELAAALNEPPARPVRTLWRMVAEDSRRAPAVIGFTLVLAAAAVIIEAMLFRGLFSLGRDLRIVGQRWWAGALIAAFLGIVLALELLVQSMLARMGRKLEVRLRATFLRKIPLLGDRYFQSRLVSDMAERSHSAHQLRALPELAASFLRPLFETALTVAAIAWFYPASAAAAAVAAAVSLGLPLLAQPALVVRDLRLRTQTGALTRFYLDALLGLTAIRAHGAERSLRREHERLLDEWAKAGLGLQGVVTAIEGAQLFASLAIVAWLFLGRIAAAGDTGALLLLAYWILRLPVLGQEAAAVAWQYPWQRNVALRLLEPLGAPEDTPAVSPRGALREGVRIELDRVTVVAAGHLILHEVSLEIAPGAQVAIVGPSGAGKSSLVGLLLGWHRPAEGRVSVDGTSLDAARLDTLRRETAWIDPQVHLWNRSLVENLRYGVPPGSPVDLEAAIESADLKRVIARLPRGMDTALGEAGALVSGGEGQRVRTGRAMLRPGVRLAILDEPARGLDRAQRRSLIAEARKTWRGATLLVITHDVAETLEFDRVVVVESGGIAEDGNPRELAARQDSRYRALLDAEDAVRSGLWADAAWRRLTLREGKLVEEPRKEGPCRSLRAVQ